MYTLSLAFKCNKQSCLLETSSLLSPCLTLHLPLHHTPWLSHDCHPSQEKLLGHLGVVLYEYLGEEYPEVLGSILGGLKVSVIPSGSPPYLDYLEASTFLLPRMPYLWHITNLQLIFLLPGNSECYWDDQDDSAHQGPATKAHPHPEKQVSITSKTAHQLQTLEQWCLQQLRIPKSVVLSTMYKCPHTALNM